MSIESLSMFFSDNVVDFFKNVDWFSLAIIYVISNIINVSVLAKLLVKAVNKLPVSFRKPILVFLNKFAKAVDEEIPDIDKKTT